MIRIVRSNIETDVAVEHLQVGDLAVTSSGEQRAIRWIGHRTLNCRNHPHPLAVLPVRIGKDALGPDKPAQDLWVSPGHAICLDVDGEVLIPASALVNGAAITQVAVDTVTYWHVELDSHDVLVANGLPAESYLDMGNRRFFAQGSVVDLAAHPDADAASRTHADFCRPFVGKGPLVDEIRARLRAKALENGWTLEQNTIAELHVGIGDQVIHPILDGATARFRLPAGCGDVRLRSLASTPSGVSDSRDGRRLGVDLKRLALCGGRGVRREIGLDDARLGRGFYPVEPLASGGLHRWTDGDALLPRSLWQGDEEGDEEGDEGEVTLLVEVAKRDLLRWNAPSAGTGHADEATGAVPSLETARSAA
ncbi:Hint domain-containing protein [Methylobacterium sp. 174MFSha1.1]|nr:Hint domain-containing protein [Methylobacterium sp. 174MFSha1.1]